MPLLVHLTPEKNAKRIERAGIKAGRHGVYCMPRVAGFYVAHQWLRELKRSGQRTLAAVYFRADSDEEAYVGHFNRPPQKLPLGQAVRVILKAPNPLGYQLLLPRDVAAAAIHKVRSVPQTVGWRYWPESHGEAPKCDCPVCLPKGMIKSRALRERLRKRP